MKKNAVKDLMYGGILELMKNREYYYYSTLGIQYSHWTDEGYKALTEFMAVMVYKMQEAEEDDLDQRAKEMVLGTLKGDKN